MLISSRNLFLLISTLFLVIGCATNYQLPQSATSIANIRLVLEREDFRAGDVAEMYNVDDTFECGKPTIKQQRLVKVSKFSIAGQSNADGLNFETSENFRILVRRVGNENSLTAICDKLFSFSPQKGRKYRVFSSLSGVECDIEVFNEGGPEIELEDLVTC